MMDSHCSAASCSLPRSHDVTPVHQFPSGADRADFCFFTNNDFVFLLDLRQSRKQFVFTLTGPDGGRTSPAITNLPLMFTFYYL